MPLSKHSFREKPLPKETPKPQNPIPQTPKPQNQAPQVKTPTPVLPKTTKPTISPVNRTVHNNTTFTPKKPTVNAIAGNCINLGKSPKKETVEPTIPQPSAFVMAQELSTGALIGGLIAALAKKRQNIQDQDNTLFNWLFYNPYIWGSGSLIGSQLYLSSKNTERNPAYFSLGFIAGTVAGSRYWS